MKELKYNISKAAYITFWYLLSFNLWRFQLCLILIRLCDFSFQFCKQSIFKNSHWLERDSSKNSLKIKRQTNAKVKYVKLLAL